MEPAGEPGRWRHNALTLIGGGVFVVFLAAVGIYTFVMAVSTRLHPNPNDVPSVALAAPSPKWTAAVDQGRRLARAGLVQQNLPGLSVAVGVRGDIVWAEGFGWADMEKRVPVAPGMRFRIGHTSKALTSAGVGLLLEQGRLHLEEEIQTYVPEFPRKQWPVTLRQLMGHMAGIRHYGSGEDVPTAHCQRAADGLRGFADDPLQFEPDSRYGYSTFGWVLVSAAVEAAAKEPLSTFMTAQVFKQLGMSATTFESSSTPTADRVTFYQRQFTGDAGEGVGPATTVDYSCFAGAGAILSTPSDLVRFGMAISRGTLLKPDTVQKLQTPQVLTSGTETEYGLGWMVEEVTLAGEPTRMVHHASRSLKGGTTSFMTFPARGMVVAVTANIANAITRDIALAIAQAFAENEDDDPAEVEHMNAGLTVVSWLDWKLGARLLLKYPALTIIGGLSLAGAIAIGAIGIELADELLYKRLPFDGGSRVVRLETQDTAASRVEPRVLHEFAIRRRSLKTVTELGAARVSERNVVTGEGRVESLRVAEITASAFPLTRVPPLLGRPLQPADELLSAEPVVVLGYDVWQRQFLNDPAIIGRVVTVGRTGRTVVGVMPPRFGFPHNEQLWVPLPVQDAPPREGPAVQVFGRLADGASWRDAASEIEVATARAAADQPATHAQLRTRVRAFAGRTPGDPLRLEDLAVHAIVLLLLAAVSANVATLIFARTAMREPEIVVRHALGASRARVVAQIVTEALVLALAAAVLGLVVAQATVRYAWARASQITGDGLPFWVDLTLEPSTIAYALLLALVAAALVGLLPALKATGASVQRGLQGITSTGGTMKFGGIWSFIIGGQVASTLLFVPAAVGIFINSINDPSTSAPFPTERYLTFRLSIDNEALAGEHGVPDDREIGARRARAYEDLAGRLRQEPGVTHVALGDRLPTMSPEWVPVEMEMDGAPPARLPGNYEGGFAMAAVGAGYHEAFGARIVAGRGLQAADARAPNGPVVVNEAFMRVVGRHPVGARIRTLQRGSEREPGPWREIVGVVTDLWTIPADWSGAAYVYRAASEAEVDPIVVAVRVDGLAAPLAPRVAVLGRQVDAGLHLRGIVTLDDIVAQEQARMTGGSVVFGSVLLVALVFSAAGLHALMAVAVARRTREIGIRIALGATPRHVLRSIFARAGRQLGGGIIAGNSIILLLAWRAESLTANLLVMSVITSVIMAAVGVLHAPPLRVERCVFNRPKRCDRCDGYPQLAASMRRYVFLFLILPLTLQPSQPAPVQGIAEAPRPRVIVSTDIGGTDPDDLQSMVHFLLYADMFDVEALISSPYGPGRREHILRVIDYYERDYANLKTHSPRYPTPDALRAITWEGAFDSAGAAGFDKPTDGSRRIVESARRADPRPLYVLVWGGIDDLAQALHDAPDILPKLRVYFIGGPNKMWSVNAYNYIEQQHPRLWIIEANSTYRGWFTGGNQSGEWGNTAFVIEHVAGRGALGGFFTTLLNGTVKMGDSPSVVYLLHRTPEDPSQPGWGGKFIRVWDDRKTIFDRLTTASDTAEAFGVVEFALSVPAGMTARSSALMMFDGRIPAPATIDGRVLRFRFSPRDAKVWSYVIKSDVAGLDGRAGEFTAVPPLPGRVNRSSVRHPNWWTDDQDPTAAEGVHRGAKHVSRWREEFLRDFATRMAGGR